MASTFPETAISTDRLLLRPFEEEDVPALVEMMNDELVRCWTAVPDPYTEHHARTWLRSTAPENRARGHGIAFAVTEDLTQRMVGVIHLQGTDWRLRSTEAGLVIAPWARGEGYAPEALLGVAQWLFEDQRFERLELRTAAGNSAAQQVAQKAGCISEGVLRSATIVRGGEPGGGGAETRTDLIVWSLLPEDLEIPAVRTPGSLGLADDRYASWV
ncbi:GNAT family N-acetyltransferase [Peterkaempfera bronchialis]|uniref:N-acetyltransferase n=1 Tax=Peterkaempfera bronchialis TaxID=2126346 RepID=A0A345T3W5_9ACTN|nr:GNAT family N-acetyltransferase [Peterkaempfera bronchialis]AXI80670.1 N-acetyltransferase [Peterkaempfera bronchialis]